MLKYKKIGKRGQVGETITWIVATLIIIAVLITFIFLSSLMARFKAIKIGDLRTDIGVSNTLEKKIGFSHQLAGNKNKEMIDEILREDEK